MKRMRFINFFLFPIIIGMTLLYVNDVKKYKAFKQLAKNKMYKWQWKLLDKIVYKSLGGENNG